MNLVIRDVFPTDCSPKNTSLNFFSGFEYEPTVVCGCAMMGKTRTAQDECTFDERSRKQLPGLQGDGKGYFLAQIPPSIDNASGGAVTVKSRCQIVEEFHERGCLLESSRS